MPLYYRVQNQHSEDQKSAMKNVLPSLKFMVAPLTGFILVMLIWLISSAAQGSVIPGPDATFRRLIELVNFGYRGAPLASHLGSSLSLVLLAVSLALLTSFPLAIVASRSKFIYGLIVPPTFFVRALPPLGYYTVLLLIFGIGELSKLALLFLASFPPLLLTLMPAIRQIPANLIEVSVMCGLSSGNHFRHVLIPALVPAIVSGTRISFGFAMSTLVAAEIVASSEGIGWMILDASRFLQTDTVFVAIGVLGATALIVDFLLSRTELLFRRDYRLQ